MRTRHVLLVGPIPPPIGGDTVSTLKVLGSKYWEERGFTLECINTSHGRHSVRVPGERLTFRDFTRGCRILLELAWKTRRADAVFLWANHRFVVTVGLPVIAWSRLCRKPVFVKPFGGHLGQTVADVPRPLRPIVLFLLRKAACVFPQTPALARELIEEVGLPAERVVVLPNFLRDVILAGSCAPKRFSGRCVFFGQIKREKGAFEIIEALEGRRDTTCDFYGPVLERDRDEFLAAVSAHPNVAYRGAVPPGSVARTAEAYDALLLPTYHVSEGYPAVVLEAYAAGIPVIAARWLSIPDIVEDGVSGILIPPKSPAAIIEAIERLRSDERLYESMCRNAHAYAHSFSEESVIGEILVPRIDAVMSSRPKRALLIGPLPPPIGGSEVLTLNVSRSALWGARGIELDCINTSPGDRVRVPEESLTPGDMLRGMRIFRDLVSRVGRSGAVLLWVNHRFLVTAGLPIIAWSRMRKKPVFIKMFGATLARQIREMPAPWRRLALAHLRACECVFPETQGLARELVEEGWLPESRVVVLPNFLPDVSFIPPRPPKRFSGRCVFIGQIKREKGVFDIIEAVGSGGKGSCDFYGPIIPRDHDDFLAAVSRRPNLSYKGLLEPAAVIGTAANYDVLLLPTYHSGDGYPASILEAYAAGIPVIATKWLHLPEIVEDRVRGILVPPQAPGAIGAAIDALAGDQRLYESMCADAAAFARRFSESSVLGEIFIPRVARVLSTPEPRP